MCVNYDLIFHSDSPIYKDEKTTKKYRVCTDSLTDSEWCSENFTDFYEAEKEVYRQFSEFLKNNISDVSGLNLITFYGEDEWIEEQKFLFFDFIFSVAQLAKQRKEIEELPFILSSDEVCALNEVKENIRNLLK